MQEEFKHAMLYHSLSRVLADEFIRRNYYVIGVDEQAGGNGNVGPESIFNKSTGPIGKRAVP